MATDVRAAALPRVVVQTNLFELCELKSLAWRVFSAREREPLAAFARAVAQSPAALAAWSDDALWVFSVNNAQSLPDADSSVDETSRGEWLASDAPSLDDAPLERLFAALQAWLARRMLQHGDFRVEHALLTLNEARFVFRRPSLARVHHLDVFLDEACAVAGLRLHFHVLPPPARWLVVNVEMVHEDASVGLDAELEGLANAWMRLMGLPRERDHSMVDVWHADDSLPARLVAETKFADIYPRFRAFPRRKLNRRSAALDGLDGAGDNDDAKGKGDDAANDADDHDGGNDNDDDAQRRGAALGKKKRRKPANEAAENEESIIPVSPDTHVNSPDISGPVVRMTFPHERSALLHADHDVHVFKRRRRKKNESNGTATKYPAGTLSFGPIPAVSATTKTPIPQLGRVRSVSNSSVASKPETPKTPALSLAVSLVASLTQDEQQEALESKPTKIHPLLQALDEYVENEMANHAKRSSVEPTICESAMQYPNAPGFSPSIDEKKKLHIARGSFTTLSYDELKSQLLSERFKRYLTGYYARDFRRNKRQQRRERERKILLEYDEAKLLEYAASVEKASAKPRHTMRDQEIAIGVQLNALDNAVPWRLLGKSSTRWTPYPSHARATDERDTLTLVHHVTPHLTQLQGLVTGKGSGDNMSDEEAGEVHDPWLTLEGYCAKTNVSPKRESVEEMHAKALEGMPRFCVANAESSLHVDIPAISEFVLRGFQPVAAPKPVDFAIVCPKSPAQWLGTLTLSYLSMFRNTYAQASLGDQVAVDVTSITSRRSVSVDADSSMLLVDCATTSDDAFATYREAGEMLRPLLSQSTKRKQAFGRSPIANVVYLVAPFRRSDIKHKLWLLGAFGRGLFGDEDVAATGEDGWAKSVTMELLYLEDLIDVSVDANPYVLLPAAMALYDRVFERMSLKPIASSDTAAKARYVCERLYHLGDPHQSSENKTNPSIVHAGYAVAPDNKWLIAAFTDSLGSVLETHTFPVSDDELATSLLSLVAAALEFVALMGDKAVLAFSQLSICPDLQLHDAWRELEGLDAFKELTLRFAPVVSRIVVLEVGFVAKETVQVRPLPSSVVKVNDHEGVMVIRSDDPSRLQERSRVSNVKWLRSTEGASHQTTVVRVRHVHAIAVDESSLPTPREELDALLTEWTALSYLTVHPIVLQRQSPLPLHLAVVDGFHSQLELLQEQLTTDPLALLR